MDKEWWVKFLILLIVPKDLDHACNLIHTKFLSTDILLALEPTELVYFCGLVDKSVFVLLWNFFYILKNPLLSRINVWQFSSDKWLFVNCFLQSHTNMFVLQSVSLKCCHICDTQQLWICFCLFTLQNPFRKFPFCSLDTRRLDFSCMLSCIFRQPGTSVKEQLAAKKGWWRGEKVLKKNNWRDGVEDGLIWQTKQQKLDRFTWIARFL